MLRATSPPEEIIRLATGQSPQEDDQTTAERQAFSRLAINEQVALVNAITNSCVQNLGYATLPQREWWSRVHGLRVGHFQTLWKKVRSTAIIVCLLPCLTSLTLEEMRKLSWFDCLNRNLVLWDEVPNTISALTRRSIRAVRRICVVPILRSVPKSRIAKAFPTLRQGRSLAHYYRPDLREHRYRRAGFIAVPSSSEILILDRITSPSEYKEFLGKAIADIETELATIVNP